jgi:N4-gp56 family major capsid protein
MANITSYGDISPAVAAWASVQMLERATPYLQLERFGQTYTLPTNNTNVAKFRRYFLTGATGAAGSGTGNFYTPIAITPLVEGVTPSGSKMANQDYTVTLAQYGDFVTITDVVEDTHTDDVLKAATSVLGESAAIGLETLRFNVLKAGTNVFRGGAVASRNLITTAPVLADIRRVTTALNRQNAKKISSVVGSSADFNTKSVEAAYFCVCHPDLETDLRVAGMKPVADYGPHTSPMEGEMGSIEQVRFLSSTVIAPYADAGGANAALRATTNAATAIDVYPMLFFGRDAFGIVPLKGKSAMTPMVVNPKPASGDPLAQRGTVGYKYWTGTVILQQAFMAILEVGATA